MEVFTFAITISIFVALFVALFVYLIIDQITVTPEKKNLIITLVGTVSGVYLAFSVTEIQNLFNDKNNYLDLLESSEILTEYHIDKLEDRLAFAEYVIENDESDYQEGGFNIIIEDEINRKIQYTPNLYGRTSDTIKSLLPIWNEHEQEFNKYYKPNENTSESIRFLKEQINNLKYKKSHIQLEIKRLNRDINKAEYSDEFDKIEEEYKKNYTEINKDIPSITG